MYLAPIGEIFRNVGAFLRDARFTTVADLVSETVLVITDITTMHSRFLHCDMNEPCPERLITPESPQTD